MSAPNFNHTAPYTLTLATGEVDRTTWWKDENRREPANVWWITGPGVSRPATDIEVDLWKQKQGREAQIEDQRLTIQRMDRERWKAAEPQS